MGVRFESGKRNQKRCTDSPACWLSDNYRGNWEVSDDMTIKVEVTQPGAMHILGRKLVFDV